ncbi:MAG TPA: hypothetical protein HA348_01245 [Thermoplasmata archaeon]|nr:hypothetical protein [Thermoplasmata archaeon]
MPYTAYVLISTTTGEEENVRKELLKIEGVVRADTTSGAFDNVVILEGESVDELIDVVIDKIRKIPSIMKTKTLVAKKTGFPMGPKEIRKEIDRLEDKIPPSALKNLTKSLEGKSITKKQFDQVAGAIMERREKELGDLTGQVKGLTKEIEDVEKLVREKREKIPMDRIEGLEERLTKIFESAKANVSISRDEENKLRQRLDEIRKKSLGLSEERLEEVERKIGELSAAIRGLSRDISMTFGERDLIEFIRETVKKVVKK